MQIDNYRCLLVELDKQRKNMRNLIAYMASGKHYTDEEFVEFCNIASEVQRACDRLPDKSRAVLREILDHLNKNMEI